MVAKILISPKRGSEGRGKKLGLVSGVGHLYYCVIQGWVEFQSGAPRLSGIVSGFVGVLGQG